MVEALIHSTVEALRKPENEKNGIRKAILAYIGPSFENDEERQKTVDRLETEDAETTLEERLEPWLTGHPDRIEELEDILDRQDGLGIVR